MTDVADNEALISLELVFVSAGCPTNEGKNEHLQIANIQFNNLDIIGKINNPSTVMAVFDNFALIPPSVL